MIWGGPEASIGVGTYWVVTPYEKQQDLTASIAGHWTYGYGGKVNPDRANALSIIQIRASIEQVLADMYEQDGKEPLVVATSASQVDATISYPALQGELQKGRTVLLLFGTAWGLAPEVIDMADLALPPITGSGAYNHLSVRSAASICLDRLCGHREHMV
ncbi:MAG: RNA methyltransferase [Candidatus Electrothrix sp. MAN1_4]|nr:RNA methyltransferase [Candidatus Electrothrix sp. MAN1_4]